MRDWQTLLILIGMPVAQILLFGFAISNEIREVSISFVDQDNSRYSREIRQKIDASNYFKEGVEIYDTQEVESYFRKGEIKMAIVVPEGFAEQLVNEGNGQLQVIIDASDPNTASLLSNYIQAIVQSYLDEFNRGAKPPFFIEVRSELVYNPELKGAYLFVPGTISVIMMLISAMMTSISITREKELGTMEVLLATPMSPVQVVLAKVVPYLLLAFFNAVVVLLMGYFIFDVPVNGSVPLLLAEMLLFIVTSLALGIFISSITSSQQVALMISLMGLMLPTILLSGFIFPVENMPLPLQVISNIVPAKWFLLIIKGIMIKGQGIAFFWKETLILLGFTLFFVVLSIKKFKIRLS